MTPVLVTLGLSKTHTVALPGRIYRRQGNHSIISLKACTEQCMLSFWWFFFLLHSRLVTVIAIACGCHSVSLARTRCVCIYIYLTFCFWQCRQKGQNNLRSEFCSAAFLRLPLFAVFFFHFSFRIFFPSPWNFQQEADTEAQGKCSARPGFYELHWYTPVEFKRSCSFAVGSYSYFVVMRGAQSHGNKPAAVVLSVLRPLE